MSADWLWDLGQLGSRCGLSICCVPCTVCVLRGDKEEPPGLAGAIAQVQGRPPETLVFPLDEAVSARCWREGRVGSAATETPNRTAWPRRQWTDTLRLELQGAAGRTDSSQRPAVRGPGLCGQVGGGEVLKTWELT